MKAEKVEDVVRHFSALSLNVRTEPDLVSDKNVVRVLAGLKKALAHDGFDLGKCETVALGDVLLPGVVPQTTQAFLVGGLRDAEVLESVITLIPGWKTRRFLYKSKTFVILSNASRLSGKMVKDSIKSYILKKKKKADDEHTHK